MLFESNRSVQLVGLRIEWRISSKSGFELIRSKSVESDKKSIESTVKPVELDFLNILKSLIIFN